MNSLTVVCVLVNANVDYTEEYVYRLKSGVSRRLPVPHEFLCISDRAVPGIDTHLIPPMPEKMPGWWAKLRLFDANLPVFTSRMLYLDLDVLPVDDLLPVVNYPSSFALIPHAGNFAGRSGLKVVPKYNSSVMIMDVAGRPDLYTPWNDEVAKRLWGDQDWIAQCCPDEDKMPLSWFPRLSEVKPPWPDEAKIVLCKKPKNHEAVRMYPWFNEMWG